MEDNNKDIKEAITIYKSGYNAARKTNYKQYYQDNKKVEPAIIFFDTNKFQENDLEQQIKNIPISIPKTPEPEKYTKEIYSEPNNLYKATYATQKGVTFKGSIQTMELNRLKKVNNLSAKLRNDTFKFNEPYQFTLNERGHERCIKAQFVDDRIVYHSFNDNIFTPKTTPYLIYDNGASLKNKGIDFTRKRFKGHLLWAHHHYNGNFYVLFIDFSKFFDNLEHNKILEYFSHILDPVELEFLAKCLKIFEIDVSYMENEEIDTLSHGVFNSLEYHMEKIKTKKESKELYKQKYTNSKKLKKSVDIGNHLSQMIGIYYPHEVDNYCKNVLQIHCYDRYMDDTAIMAKTKKELQDILSKIDNICNKIGLHINKRKTRIINPYKGPATFLKINYFITDTGKILEKVHSDAFHREMRRIPKLLRLVENNIISAQDFINCYKSWRGSYWRFDSKLDILNLDKFVANKMIESQKIVEYINTDPKLRKLNPLQILRLSNKDIKKLFVKE